MDFRIITFSIFGVIMHAIKKISILREMNLNINVSLETEQS